MIIKNGILIEVENKDIPESGIIVIPDNVKAIAQYAFYNATKMEEVIFSEHVCAVGEGAFWKCENLRRVQFSDEVLAIGGAAFDCCTKIEKIILPCLLYTSPSPRDA